MEPTFDPEYDMPITKDVSQILAEHYGYKCQLSGKGVHDGGFHVDHVFPKALGGRDNLQNYVIAESSANIGKNARRLPEEIEVTLLQQARLSAPDLLGKLIELRSVGGGRPVNPIVVFAFRIIGAEVGSRVATGAYLRAQDGPASGLKWWGYFGPDRTNGSFQDILQFGIKAQGIGTNIIPRIQALDGIRERGGNTLYFPISAKLPKMIDKVALLAARDRLTQACR